MKFTRLLVSLSTIMGVTMANASEIRCPTTIVVKEIVMNQKGWGNTEFPSAKTLKSSTLFAGKLGDTSGALAPEQQEKNAQLFQTWDLKAYHAKNEPVWLECQYFETAVKLRKVIPSTMTTCESTFLLDQAHNPKESTPLSCK